MLIHTENCPEMVLSWYACATVGAVAVTTNTKSVGPEMTYLAGHAQCVAAITQPQYAALVSENAPALKWIAVTEDNSGEPADRDASGGGRGVRDPLRRAGRLPGRPVEPMLPVGIMYTSGTTSRPRPSCTPTPTRSGPAGSGPATSTSTGDDIYLIYLPFFHVNAQSWSHFRTLGVGGTVVLHAEVVGEPLLGRGVRRGVTHISLLPFVFRALMAPDKPAELVAGRRLRAGRARARSGVRVPGAAPPTA